MFTINENEIYYWGSLDVSIKEANVMEQVFLNKGGTFSITFSDTPTKREVLEMAVDRVESTGWESLISAEMNKQ